MSFLARLFNSTTTTITETYTIADVSGVPATMDARRTAFRPEVLAVEYRNGRFRELRISGPAVGHPTVRVTRFFHRWRDVPQWVNSASPFERVRAKEATEAEIDRLSQQIINEHTALYHPGRPCRENERGECADRPAAERG